MALLRLGTVDKGSEPSNKYNFLLPFHASLTLGLRNKLMFRDEDQWRSFNSNAGKEVKETQEFLEKAGFLQAGNVDGIYGYRTRAAVRLFQEYVRSVEPKENKKGYPDIGTPDGMVGNDTRKHFQRWRDTWTLTAEGKEQEGKLYCEWGKASSDNPSEEYTKWLGILENTKEHFKDKTPEIIKASDAYNLKLAAKGKSSDTRLLEKWTCSKNEIHLIGIRRNEDLKRSQIRENDDVFILLLNGMVFKFWGSTDPNPNEAKRSDEAFLIEGQHLYKIAWHKISSQAKAYSALKPLTGPGPLIFRDEKGKDALTDENVKAGIQGPNNAINIHWSGVGSYNFSAGCQVIAGKSYINHLDEVVDCSSYAARNSKALKKVAGQKRKTKGAYNVVADLISVYRPKGLNTIVYTLGRDDNLDDSPDFKKGHAKKLLKRMKG